MDVNRPEILRITYRKEDISKDFTLFSVKALSQDAFLSEVKVRLVGSEKFKDQAIVGGKANRLPRGSR